MQNKWETESREGKPGFFREESDQGIECAILEKASDVAGKSFSVMVAGDCGICTPVRMVIRE